MALHKTNTIYPVLPDEASEKVNAHIHQAGIVLGIFLLPLLLFFVSKDNYHYALGACLIYGLCFVMTFTLSSLFHSCRIYPRRAHLKILDRISIYFLIAGSYTPLIAFYLKNNLGITLLILLWAMAIVGVFFELYLVKKYILISVPFYLLMGCMFVFTANPFFAAMPYAVIMLILIGVILYISGVVFYMRHKNIHNHAVWHAFVLAAALCHYAAIILTAVVL